MTASSPSQAEWYIAENGVQRGPYTWAELVQRAIDGEITPEQFVFRLGEQTWKKASDVAGLFEPVTKDENDDPNTEVGIGTTPNLEGGVSGLYPSIPGYRFLRKLGQGGMGTVYEAEHLEQRRLVALKVLNENRANDQECLKRFKGEAAALMRIEHPNIVRIHDSGEVDERPYLTMELISGGDLATELKKDRWSVERATALLETIARAVHVVHQAGIIHRDLKPENIMLTLEGEPVLVDFGIAKDPERVSLVTLAGSIMGTPNYLAPEQVRGESGSMDARTDVYALGVILYEMLCGAPPFVGEFTPLVYQILNKLPKALREVNPEVPSALEAICLKCLEKESDDRYASALELADALRDLDKGPPEGPEPDTLEGNFGFIYSVAYSPDGKHILAGGEDGTMKVWNSRTGKEVLTLKGNLGVIYSVAFSPDGKNILSGADDGTVILWDSRTGKELLTIEGHSSSVWSVALTPDGRRIISGSQDKTVKVWDVHKGQVVRTLRGHTDIISSVAMSSDGVHLASGSWDKTIKVWNLSTGREELSLEGHTGSVLSLSFSPDGKRLVSGSDDGTLKMWDVRSGQAVLSSVGHTSSVSGVAFGSDSRYLASGSLDKTVKVWNATTGKVVFTLDGHTHVVSSVAFGPEGKRLVSASWDGTVKVWKIT